MKRCFDLSNNPIMRRAAPVTSLAMSLVACGLCLGGLAQAQGIDGQAAPGAYQFVLPKRNFAPNALRGSLTVIAPPEVELNGQRERLAPGARIRDANNMMVMSGAMLGKTYVVNYVRDAAGLIGDVWLLNAEEAREKRATTPNAVMHSWGSGQARPVDDGKTPFERLPKFRNTY